MTPLYWETVGKDRQETLQLLCRPRGPNAVRNGMLSTFYFSLRVVVSGNRDN